MVYSVFTRCPILARYSTLPYGIIRTFLICKMEFSSPLPQEHNGGDFDLFTASASDAGETAVERESGSSCCRPACLRAIRALHDPQSTRFCIFDTATALDPTPKHDVCGRPLGQVLAVNQDAVKCAMKAVECPSCWDQSAVQLAVSIICDKLISWNEAVVQSATAAATEAVQPNETPPLSSFDVSALDQATGSKVLFEDVRIGDFVADPSGSLARQLGLVAAMDGLQATDRLLRAGEARAGGSLRSCFSETIQKLDERLAGAKPLASYHIQKCIVNCRP